MPVELIQQLPAAQKVEFFRLLQEQWQEWDQLSQYANRLVRLTAQEHDRTWDTMSETKQKSFIDDLVHESECPTSRYLILK